MTSTPTGTDPGGSRTSTPTAAGDTRGGIEVNGLNTIDESERRGTARDLFWPWFGANVSVFGISYGSFLLGFGVSFAQATVIAVVGVVISFLLCGFVALAGKRGSAPTMVLSRAAFGVRGNRLPSLLSWVLTVGWETVLTSLAVLSTATVLDRLGAGGGTGTKVVALVVVAALVVAAGVAGFSAIMRLQRWITVITGVLTVAYVLLVLDDIDLGAVAALPAGSAAAVDRRARVHDDRLRAGLGQRRRRLLPLPAAQHAGHRGDAAGRRSAASLAPVLLVFFGVLLAGSSPDLADGIGDDPIGALHDPAADLVPHPLRARRGPGPGRRGGARHLLLRPGPAERRRAHPAARRRGRRRRADGRSARSTSSSSAAASSARSRASSSPSASRSRRGAASCWPTSRCAARDYDEPDLYDRRGRYGDVRLVAGRAAGRGHRARLGAGDQHLRRLAGLAGLPARARWAAARGPGRSRTSACCSRWSIGFVGTLALTAGAVRRQEDR